MEVIKNALHFAKEDQPKKNERPFFLRALLLTLSLSLVACKNGVVTIADFPIELDGLSIPSNKEVLNTSSLDHFQISGECDPSIENIFFRFDSSSSWVSIKKSSGLIECATKGTFSFQFNSQADASFPPITSASSYTPKSGSEPAHLIVYIMGQTKNTTTKIVSVMANEINPSKTPKLVLSKTTTLSGSNTRLKGQLLQQRSTNSSLPSTTSDQFAIKPINR